MSSSTGGTAAIVKQGKANTDADQKQATKIEAKAKENAAFYSLRFRSTGLGTTMMEGEPDGFNVMDDMLIMYIQTTTPTRWKIRSALTYKALVKVIWQALRWKVIKFVLFGWWHYKNPKLSKDF